MDVQTGEPKVFDRAGGAPLLAAVTASTAMPGVYPPITVNSHRYMDGGLRSGTNADLATGARLLVVIEPLAHLFPRDMLAYEISVADPQTVVTISPDTQAIDARPRPPSRPRPVHRAAAPTPCVMERNPASGGGRARRNGLGGGRVGQEQHPERQPDQAGHDRRAGPQFGHGGQAAPGGRGGPDVQ